MDPRSTSALVAAIVASLMLTSVAESQTGVQVTPDRRRTLVSKDLGGQRWAITLNADDRSVTGNVFSGSASQPSFVWCNQVALGVGTTTFGCSGASRCAFEPCVVEEWSLIADVALPDAFFSANAEAPAGMSLNSVSGGAPVEAPSSGLQVTPLRRRTLLSKDVLGQRWAITRHEDDGSVTGNVLDPNGGPPSFVWCEETGATDTDLEFRCLGSGVCTAEPCPGQADWTLIDEGIRLPRTFFAAPAQVEVGTVVESASEGLGGPAPAFDALTLALDRGYTLPQIVRAALAGNTSLGLAPRLSPRGVVTVANGEEAPPDTPAEERYIDLGFVNRPSSARTSALGAAATVGEEQIDFEGIRLLRQDFETPMFSTAPISSLLDLDRQGFLLDAIADASIEDRLAADADGRVEILTAAGGRELPTETAELDILLYSAFCGNGRVDRGEECEVGVPFPNGETCETFGRVGELLCSDCKFDLRTGCLPPKATDDVAPACGNGAIEGDEECDQEALGGRTCRSLGRGPGTLSCRNVREPGACVLDLAGCQCGDGRRNHPDEECDGNDLGPQGMSCSDLGLGDGAISCSQECALITTGCSGVREPGGICGDGVRNGNEACDGLDTSACLGACLPSCECAPVCGNGIIEPGEGCDGADVGGFTCSDAGFVSNDGTLGCDDNCVHTAGTCAGVCGNGIREPDEPCDGSDIPLQCTDFNFAANNGTLECDDSCMLTAGTCTAVCGNGIIEFGEACDGANLGGATCTDAGFASNTGTLGCDDSCMHTAGTCAGMCGNGIREPDEACDGSDMPFQCTDFNFASNNGTLECDDGCMLTAGTCTAVCGNGIIEFGEACDGADIGGATCTDAGFGSNTGSLACGPDCSHRIGTCTSVCGDGVVEPTEECDFNAPDVCTTGSCDMTCTCD